MSNGMAVWGPSIVACLMVGGCSSDDVTEDAGVTPSMDAMVAVDGGVTATCTLAENNPSCQAATDCKEDSRTSPSACEWCPTTGNDTLCATGQCVNPALLAPGMSVDFAYNITGLEGQIESFAGLAVAQTTAGGLRITCQDVYDSPPSIWSNSCYNILDVGYTRRVGEPGQTYLMQFTQFASGQPTLFIVYGFADDGASGEPIGVTCKEESVGTGSLQVSGDTMQQIE